MLHSGLSDRERLNAWLLARAGIARVVVGTRSAIFAPLRAPGILIVDEEHDPSFKQQGWLPLSRPRPGGHSWPATRDSGGTGFGHPAWKVATTPSAAATACCNCRNGSAAARKHHRNSGRASPADGRGTVVAAAGANADPSGPQRAGVAIFNRRGFAPILLCHECGWLSQCRHCDARMTLHLRQRRLICHHCGDSQPVDAACPLCGSVDLRALGHGTERLEAALRREFPETDLTRMDRDSTRRRGSLEALLADIHNGDAAS